MSRRVFQITIALVCWGVLSPPRDASAVRAGDLELRPETATLCAAQPSAHVLSSPLTDESPQARFVSAPAEESPAWSGPRHGIPKTLNRAVDASTQVKVERSADCLLGQSPALDNFSLFLEHPPLRI